MRSQKIIIIMAYAVVVIFILDDGVLFVNGMATSEKKELKEKVLEMFMHAYRSYMNNAYPADELMPLSCKGRYRGTEPNRGDIDDSLGNFTLTLIDTLDTLVVLGELEEFDKAVRLVIGNTKFDADVVVSVFETNIRVLGGLLGGHVLAAYLKKKKKAMEWYNDELLAMAKDVGYRLLPAFNTSTGIPYSRINLKHGISDDIHDRNRDTCTACAGTIILEFAALSRLTNEEIFEEKAHKAMDYLWKQRHRSSDLVGTVLNVHTGDWIRRESGVGAGIDSYYEYVLKAYILLGDDIYLNRFNKHYSAVMKYISQGPMLLDVHMHKPHAASRNFMDALLAFWPGLQVLKGDIQPAIKTHEMLYQLIQKHNFLPEAFTTDFRVHWGHHPLRPEFVESTYFLHKATGDSHYLRVGKRVVENMNNLARVPCGFAGIKDVSTGGHEDQMDSYVFAETFKYLYLLFAEESDLVINIDDYLFTTEAHLLPLSLSVFNASAKVPKIRREVYNQMQDFDDEEYYEANVDTSYTEDLHHSTCPNPQYLYKNTRYYAHNLRTELQGMVEKISPPQFRNSHRQRLRASEFIAGNKAQLEMLHDMGIRIATMSDGRVQLLHSATDATSPQDAEDGMRFMQEMIELSRQQQNEPQLEPSVVQFLSGPYFGSVHFLAGTAQFGYNLKKNPPVQGSLAVAEPFNACQPITNPLQLSGHIAILERGNCMFVDKARNLQLAGAVGGIVIDHTEGSTSGNQPLFAMSGDGTQDVIIPMVFLYHKEGQQVIGALKAANYNLQVLLASRVKDPKELRHSTDDEQSQHSLQAEGPPVDHSTTDSSTQQASGTSDGSNENILIKQEETPKKVFQHLQSLQHVSGNAQKHYKIMAGSSNVEIEVKDGEKETNLPKEQQVSDKYIEIVSLPDGSKQIQFNFAHLGNKKAQTKPELNQIYVEIVNILQTKTNFNKLDNQADYLMAIARLLEAAYFGLEKVDANAQRLFDKLTNELEIIEKEENNEILQSADSDTIQSENSLHFSSSDAENDQSDESLHSGSFDDKNDQSADFSQGSNEPEGDQTDEVKIREILSDNDHAQHYATSQDFSEVNEPIQELGAEEVENKNTFHVHLDNDNNNIEKSENIEHDYSEIQNNMQETQSHKHTSKIPASLENNDPTPRGDSLNDKSESSDDERTLNIETNTDINKPHRTNDEL